MNPFLAVLCVIPLATSGGAGPDTPWPNQGNDKGASRFSTLDQINTKTVADLAVAWVYHTGDSDGQRPLQCAPIVIDGVMYVSTVQTNIAALDPATGRELWRFDTRVDTGRAGHRRSNRGVAYWSDASSGADREGARRILMGIPDGRVVSLDARTGRPDPSFGSGGQIDLHELVEERWKNGYIGISSAPMVYRDLVFIGVASDEGYGAVPGDIVALNVRTGAVAWRFKVIPEKGEPGSETWLSGGRDQSGGAGPWNGFSLDDTRGILFAATGSASGDFYGGRRLGDNLYANCVLALDAATGRLLWHFQTTHHDLWDHDNASQPVLCTIRRDGKPLDVVVELCKTGLVFVLERDTGRPVFGVREVPAPASDIDGEHAAPTQPEPLLPEPFVPLVVTEDSVSDITPEARRYMLDVLGKHRHGTRYLPPCPEGTVVAPGYHGGAAWGGGAFDPSAGTLYFNVNNEPSIIEMGKNGSGGFTYQWFRDKDGYPGVKPPWGMLKALDLSTGTYRWSAVLGEYPELTASGIPQTGTPNMGGPLCTAGGLVFIGATKDAKIRAFDSANGAVLWEHALPAPAYSWPCTYSVAGRQHLVIGAGGGAAYGAPAGDAFVAFALPGRSVTGSSR